MLASEETDRQTRPFKRLEQQAGFRYKASVEELKTDAARGLSSQLIAKLSMGKYIENGEAILITGATGCGKSFLASAPGHQACAQGYSIVYYNMLKLLVQMKLRRLERSSVRFFCKLVKTRLFSLDDFGLTHPENQQQMDLLEIIEDRYARKSTIIASQLPVAGWYDVIGEESIADALLDRLLHTSHRIGLQGESLRKKLSFCQ